MKIAGVLDGWEITASGLEDEIELVEDEDMRRTREAKGQPRRW